MSIELLTKAHNPLILKLAVFESTGRFPYQMIYNEEEATVTDMARVSRWTEVEFHFRDEPAEILAEKVAALDKAIDSKKRRMLEELDVLVKARQDLLSIGYDQPPASRSIESNTPPLDPLIDDDIPF